jgi:hypothetical protein
MIERCLQAEMEEHLGYPKHGRKQPDSANTRNGSHQKTLKGEHGELEAEAEFHLELFARVGGISSIPRSASLGGRSGHV